MCNIVTHLFSFIEFSPFSDESYPLFSLFPSYFSTYHIQGFCPCNFLYRFSPAYPSSVLYLVFLTASSSLLCQQFLRQLESRTNTQTARFSHLSIIEKSELGNIAHNTSVTSTRRTEPKTNPRRVYRSSPFA